MVELREVEYGSNSEGVKPEIQVIRPLRRGGTEVGTPNLVLHWDSNVRNSMVKLLACPAFPPLWLRSCRSWSCWAPN